MPRLIGLVVFAAACSAVEPLDLPADPAEVGVPVGVRTMTHDGLTVEVWYPAVESSRGEPTVAIDFRDYVPDVVAEALGAFEVPLIQTIAVRDADVRDAGDRYPVVLFSHGLGGTRTQSPDLVTHLASRGYVVLATDHAGRAMPYLLPCLFRPALEGCELSFGGDDPADDDIATLIELAETLDAEHRGAFEGRLDLDALALTGHSAGAGTTARVGNQDTRLRALLPMAAGAPITRDVPTLRLAGTCDQTVPYDALLDQHATGGGHLLAIDGAGHLAFSDLCQLELDVFAATYLSERTDINRILLDQLLGLATDGCPGITPVRPAPECETSFLSLDTSHPIIRHYATVFFDDALRGVGPGPTADVFPPTRFDPSP